MLRHRCITWVLVACLLLHPLSGWASSGVPSQPGLPHAAESFESAAVAAPVTSGQFTPIGRSDRVRTWVTAFVVAAIWKRHTVALPSAFLNPSVGPWRFVQTPTPLSVSMDSLWPMAGQTIGTFLQILSMYGIYRLAFDAVKPSWFSAHEWLTALAGKGDPLKIQRAALRVESVLARLDRLNSMIDELIVRMVSPYFKMAAWERRGTIYRRMGVDRFRRILMRWIPLTSSPFHFYNIGLDPERFIVRTRSFELVHLYVAWLLLDFLRLIGGQVVETHGQYPGLLPLGIAIFIGAINTYLIFVQRSNRARLQTVLERTPSLLRRRLAAQSGLSPPEWKKYLDQMFAVFWGYFIATNFIFVPVVVGAWILGHSAAPLHHPLFLLLQGMIGIPGAHAALKIQEYRRAHRRSAA